MDTKTCTMKTEIKIVKTRKDEKEFINFPAKLYKGNEYWVPALEGDEYDTFNPEKNGAYDYCEAERFLAYKDGKLVGRVAAIINHNANRDWKEESVRFGWLDFIEDQEVLEALLKAVEDWGKQRGCKVCKGPWGFTDMDKEGLLIEGYDKLCPFTCLYNYPYYDTLLQKAGYAKDVDWIQKVCYLDEKDPPMFGFAEMIEKRFGLHMAQEKSMKVMADKYGMDLFRMYNETFAPLFQFTPLNDKQIESYLKTYVSILDPRFVGVCLNAEDKPIGFAFCVPTLSKAIQKCKGRLFPFGFLRVLHALKHNDTLEALLIGILPEYQGQGANVLLFKYLHENARKFGINKMILNPQLEENFRVHALFDQYRTEPFMRRRAYTKNI